MGLKLVTPPAVEPVSVADAKSFLRVGIPDDDALISDLIVAARQYCESYLNRQLITATYDLSFDTFPLYAGTQFPWPFMQQVPVVGAYQLGTYYMQTPNLGVLSPADQTKLTLPNIGNIALPKPALQSITSIKYLDVNGVQQTLATSTYQVVSTNTPGYIKPTAAWPAIASNTAEAVVIRFVAGYGDTGASVPGTINVAIKLLLASWYETRQPGEVLAGIEQAVHNLLNQYSIEGCR